MNESQCGGQVDTIEAAWAKMCDAIREARELLNGPVFLPAFGPEVIPGPETAPGAVGGGWVDSDADSVLDRALDGQLVLFDVDPVERAAILGGL